MTATQVHLPSELQKRAARAGWRLSTTTNGYMLVKGSYSRHYGELRDLLRALHQKR